MTGILLVVMVPAIASASPACYGTACIGLNPTERCDGDAKTIGAMDVEHEGMLELRWSKWCNASWGRFSTYWRSSASGTKSGVGLTYARVTSWNPGEASQPVDGFAKGSIFGDVSWWTKMVDGSRRSCTGVELFIGLASDTKTGNYTTPTSLGWTGGPCVD
jgi:hypothetical protein